MNVLAIDTASESLCVAIQQNNKTIAEWTTLVKNDHSSRLMPAIVYAMEQVQMEAKNLDAIIVGQGPGSYTGTRIGITTAKTLAWSLQIPVYPVSSLSILAYNAIFHQGYIVPFFDARRKTVFTSLYYSNGVSINEVQSEKNIPMDVWIEELNELDEPILFLSPQIENFKEMIVETSNQKFLIAPTHWHFAKASNMFMLKENEINVHAITPNYLRITEAEAKLLREQKEFLNES